MKGKKIKRCFLAMLWSVSLAVCIQAWNGQSSVHAGRPQSQKVQEALSCALPLEAPGPVAWLNITLGVAGGVGSFVLQKRWRRAGKQEMQFTSEKAVRHV